MLAAAAAIERPHDGAQDGNNGDPGEPNENLAGKPCHRRPLRVEAKVCRKLPLGFRRIAAHHRGLPSMRTMRTFC